MLWRRDLETPARKTLHALLDAAISVARPDVCLAPHLPAIPPTGRLIVLGAGKAAAAMAQAAEAHYEGDPGYERLSGMVTTRHGYGLATRRIEVVEAGHPVPDTAGQRAAERTLALAGAATAEDLVLVLLSGGASALWSAPVAGLDFAGKQALTRKLLGSGARIDEMNTVRKHLSRIKGGRLAVAAHPAEVVTLAISDVPRDDPATIGSGPTVADPTTLADARAILAHYAIDLDPAVARALGDAANETPKPGATELDRSRFVLVARPQASLEAAARLAATLGYRPVIIGDALEGEARELARHHASLARESLARGERVALLSGGEVTVTLRGTGEGGPNQEYALALAIALEGAAGIAALAADTDGTDGGSGRVDDPAGAIVDATTLARASACHLDAAKFLDNNDSTGFFRSVGDLVIKGPTQTNVNDFRAILIDPA
ncbi:MAG: glycerate kinase [Hyphomicrobiaceae bacterium]|nr:glycerate kinase [Hyphomicrobiaceae bacterium]